MLNNRYICTLDIGSSKLAAAVARIRKGRLSEVFFASSASRGIRQGKILEPVELSRCISSLLKALRDKSGIAIKYVYANLSGNNIVTRHSRAIIPLAERGNKVITLSDVEKACEQARILGSDLEEEIIHSLPYNFSIDSMKNILNPLGLYSHRLEVDLYLICGKASSLQNITRVVNQSGYEIKDLFFSGLGTSRAMLGREAKDALTVFCDIGRDASEILVFNSGLLQEIRCVQAGGEMLTQALAEDLRLPFVSAEELKISHGSAGNSQNIEEKKEILLKQGSDYQAIQQKAVVESLSKSTASISRLIRDSVADFISGGRIDNFVVAGRTVILDGFLETLEDTLGIPVRLGKLAHPAVAFLAGKEEALAGQKYLSYASALGLIALALENDFLKVTPLGVVTSNPLLKLIQKSREIYQEYF